MRTWQGHAYYTSALSLRGLWASASYRGCFSRERPLRFFCGGCSEAICTLPPHTLILASLDTKKLMRLISETCTPQLHRAIQGWLSYFGSSAVQQRIASGLSDNQTCALGIAVMTLTLVGSLVQKLIGFINETCTPRLHWAKAGWPRYLSCFDGSVAYPNTWCDFGCAVQVSGSPNPTHRSPII